jgi:hypothetical protein
VSIVMTTEFVGKNAPRTLSSPKRQVADQRRSVPRDPICWPNHRWKSTSSMAARAPTHAADQYSVRRSRAALMSSEKRVPPLHSSTSTTPTRPLGAYPTKRLPPVGRSDSSNRKFSLPNVVRRASRSEIGSRSWVERKARTSGNLISWSDHHTAAHL